MNTAEHIVQAQLDAYNARDLQAFVAGYDDQIEVFRPPAAEPGITGITALAQHYADKRFNLPDLHAELVNRMVIGQKVIDHERVHGVAEHIIEAAAVYEVIGQKIVRVWFY